MGAHGGGELDDPELSGERLTLRRRHPGDDEPMLPITPGPPGFVDAAQFVARERSSGRVVGLGALRPGVEAEIACWLAPGEQEHGYAAEVVRLLADWGFGRGLPRIEVGCDVRDLATARAALAAGFAFEGISRDAAISDQAGGAAERADRARFARLAADPGDPIPPRFAELPAGGLTDGVLSLRVTQPDDATGLFETDDETTLRWSFTGERHTLAQARRATAQAGLIWLVGSVAQVTMVDVDSGDYAGELHLRAAGPPQVGGIGYVVHPLFRGRGFTTRALRLLTPWAFGPQAGDPGADFARLELGAKTANVASLRAAVSAGFAPDGVRRTRLRAPDGTFADETRFVLLNPRYTAPVAGAD